MMKRLGRQLFRVTGALLGAIFALILLEVVVSALGGGSHRIADWAVGLLGKIFQPVGKWFVGAPDWAWVSVVVVLGFPAAWVLTWALDEAGLGIKRQYKIRWIAAIWILVVATVCACIQWARAGHGF
jgi:hypothetical protein